MCQFCCCNFKIKNQFLRLRRLDPDAALLLFCGFWPLYRLSRNSSSDGSLSAPNGWKRSTQIRTKTYREWERRKCYLLDSNWMSRVRSHVRVPSNAHNPLKLVCTRINNWDRNKLTLFGHVWFVPCLVAAAADGGVVVDFAADSGHPTRFDIERCANSAANATEHLSDNSPIPWCPTLCPPSMPDISIANQTESFQPKCHPTQSMHETTWLFLFVVRITARNFPKHLPHEPYDGFCMCYIDVQQNVGVRLAFADAANHSYCIYEWQTGEESRCVSDWEWRESLKCGTYLIVLAASAIFDCNWRSKSFSSDHAFSAFSASATLWSYDLRFSCMKQKKEQN